jgi:hypothetical protein
MIHVWTDVPNPAGIYGHDNPALPFIVLGLTPPEMSELHDAAGARAVRALALALGETYGARLENAYLIEQANQNVGLADSIRAHPCRRDGRGGNLRAYGNPGRAVALAAPVRGNPDEEHDDVSDVGVLDIAAANRRFAIEVRAPVLG